MIAQCLAVFHAELVEKLVIAVSAPRVNELMYDCLHRWIDLAKQRNYQQLIIDTAEKSYSPQYLVKYRKMYPFVSLLAKPSDYSRFLINARAILQFDVLQNLQSIRCPTLIIGGDDDQIVGIQASFEMHQKIANSQLHVYPGLGHAAYEEAKDFYQLVYNFLEVQQINAGRFSQQL